MFGTPVHAARELLEHILYSSYNASVTNKYLVTAVCCEPLSLCPSPPLMKKKPVFSSEYNDTLLYFSAVSCSSPALLKAVV